MQLHHVVAEVAATSTKRRDAASKRAGGGYWGVLRVEQNNTTEWRIRFERTGTVHVQNLYASPEEAARAWDALAWEFDGWYAVATYCMLTCMFGACESCIPAACMSHKACVEDVLWLCVYQNMGATIFHKQFG